jgi:hypothetical protein
MTWGLGSLGSRRFFAKDRCDLSSDVESGAESRYRLTRLVSPGAVAAVCSTTDAWDIVISATDLIGTVNIPFRHISFVFLPLGNCIRWRVYSTALVYLAEHRFRSRYSSLRSMQHLMTSSETKQHITTSQVQQNGWPW